MFEEYKAFKEKVGVDDVASYLGYKLDRKAGVGKFVEYNIRDGRGRKIDSIVISHPNEKSSQTYFHRNGASFLSYGSINTGVPFSLSTSSSMSLSVR